MEQLSITPGSAGGEQPRAVEGGRGVAWWSEAWALFAKNAGIWIVLGLILFVIMVVLSLIPLIGFVATSLLLPVLAGGWMAAAERTDRGGGAVEVGDLFAAFKGERLNQLLVVGALFLVMVVVIGAAMFVLGLGGVMGAIAGGARRSAGGVMAGIGMGLFALAVGLLLGLVATMAVWFATPLVALRNVAPVEAIKLSFAASLKNVVPFLVWGVIYIGAAIVASIPFGLGWVVLAPLLMLTVYTSYKDVFGG
ncbi:MAG: hypothetical protein JNJ89_01405 [Rubrivivax sp.]|nr:hypothetical protein [Rubrivivax sp.]